MYCENCEGIEPTQEMVKIDERKILLHPSRNASVIISTFKCPRCGIREEDGKTATKDYEINGEYPKELISLKERDPEEFKRLSDESWMPKNNFTDDEAIAFGKLIAGASEYYLG